MKPPRLVIASVLVLVPLAAACGSSSKTTAGSTPSTPSTAVTPSTVVTTAAAATSAPDADYTAPKDTADADASSSAADQSPDPDASKADTDADPGDATKACDADALTADPDAAAALPAGFPTVSGFTAISKVTQGSTVAIKGAITGGPDDLPTVRDTGIKLLEAAGYKEGDHDQEAGAEADGDFTGPHNGNINVRNLCKGHLVVTYTLNN
jgi:hypothetical protein